MTLISLLLVLTIERMTIKSPYWHGDYYFSRYHGFIVRQGWLDGHQGLWVMAAVVAAPALLMLLLLDLLNSGLLTFVAQTAVLMVCLGCSAQRQSYKGFLQAANRGDLQACDHYASEAGHKEDIGTFGQTLLWINYRYYAAVVLWFVVFGAAGAVLYVTARNLHSSLQEQSNSRANMEKVMAVIDWVPVRLTALGFLLVGHFTRAFPVWLGYLPDPAIDARTLLQHVAKAAEDVEPDDTDCTEEPCTLVRLAKRNLTLIIVVIALLTLSGWID